MYCSVVYCQSCGGGAGIHKQTMFLNVGKPKSMRDLRGEFCEVASFHSTYARSQTKTGCEEPSLFSTRAKYRSGDFCAGKVQTRRTVSPVGTLLLMLLLLLLLLLCEAKDSLPTKNIVEVRSNDVGTTAGERGLIPGQV